MDSRDTPGLRSSHARSIVPNMHVCPVPSDHRRRLRFFCSAIGGHTYEAGWSRNVKPYCSNIALAVIERRYAR